MQPTEGADSGPERVGLKFYVQELKWLLRLGLPISATVCFDMLQRQLAVAFAGHSRKEELDALGLANTYYNLFVMCPAFAISGAFSGRLGAAFGARRLDVMRADLHRSILVGAVFLFGAYPLRSCCILTYPYVTTDKLHFNCRHIELLLILYWELGLKHNIVWHIFQYEEVL